MGRLRFGLPSGAFLASDDGNTTESARGERRDGGLHANFDGFKRAERDIGDQLSRSTGGKI